MSLAEQLKQEQLAKTVSDWRKDRFLEVIAKEFRKGASEVNLSYFGLFAGVSDEVLPVPSEFKFRSPIRCEIRIENNRYVAHKYNGWYWGEGFSVSADVTDTEFPYRGFVNNEDRDAKICILENAGFKTYTCWVCGKGDVTTVTL